MILPLAVIRVVLKKIQDFKNFAIIGEIPNSFPGNFESRMKLKAVQRGALSRSSERRCRAVTLGGSDRNTLDDRARSV